MKYSTHWWGVKIFSDSEEDDKIIEALSLALSEGECIESYEDGSFDVDRIGEDLAKLKFPDGVRVKKDKLMMMFTR